MSLYELLYVSELSPATSTDAVSDIFVRSRCINAQHGLTGLLVFDGARFIHYLEGIKDDALALMQRIERDSRHRAVARLHEGPAKSRRFNAFGVGYWYVGDDQQLTELKRLMGPSALDKFLAVMHEFDVF